MPMAGKPTAAFVLALAGGSFQLFTPGVLNLLPDIRVSRGAVYLDFSPFFFTLLFTGLILVWSSVHLHSDPGGRVAWSSIIVAMAIVNTSNIALYSLKWTFSDVVVPAPSLVLLAGPILALVGGIIGLAGARNQA